MTGSSDLVDQSPDVKSHDSTDLHKVGFDLPVIYLAYLPHNQKWRCSTQYLRSIMTWNKVSHIYR